LSPTSVQHSRRPEGDFIVPLDKFFTGQHLANSGGFARDLAFYAQVRGVIAFLIERSEDPAVFGSIAASAQSGLMDDWLRANGLRYHL